MKKAITQNNTVIRWPASLDMLRKMTNASIPQNAQPPLTVEQLTLQHPEPVSKPAGDVVIELAPEFIDGVLTQKWATRDYNQTEIDQQKDKRAIDVKAECTRRIYEVVNPIAQINLAAAAGGGVLTAGQMTIYQSGLAWIKQSRDNCIVLEADENLDIMDDNNWPTPTVEMIALAEEF